MCIVSLCSNYGNFDFCLAKPTKIFFITAILVSLMYFIFRGYNDFYRKGYLVPVSFNAYETLY